MVKTKGNQKIVGMHPRNVLRTQPDYTKMAIKYKDFRQQCQLVSKNYLFCLDIDFNKILLNLGAQWQGFCELSQ